MGNGPVGKYAATAAAGHTELLLVYVAAFEQFVDSGHQITIIVPGIVILNDVAEILSVTGGASRIGVKNYIALGGHPLKLVVKDPAVRSVGTSVNIEDQRILLMGIEVRRLLDPALDALAIEAGVIDLLGRSQIELRRQLLIEICDARLCAVR